MASRAIQNSYQLKGEEGRNQRFLSTCIALMPFIRDLILSSPPIWVPVFGSLIVFFL